MRNKGMALLAIFITFSLSIMTACSSNKNTTSENTPNQTSNVAQADAAVQAAANDNSFPKFSTTDLNGNKVDNSSFADYKITMLNIWGTFCKPCIGEMSDLESLNKKMPEGTRLVGLAFDASDDEHKKLAKQIVSENKVTYQNLFPDDALTNYVENNVTGVPTTLFIDSNGNIVGDAVIGVHSVDEYLSELQSRLNQVEGKSSNSK